MVEREDNYVKTGDVVIFGKYPMELVEDKSLALELNKCARLLPTKEDPKYWHAYEYVVKRERVDFMWYTNVGPYRGEYYRGVYFTEYRPKTADKTEKNHIPEQQNNGFEPGKIYWFKLEDIRWNVLTEDGEVAFLVADRILDAQSFYAPTEDSRTVNGVPVFQNNYAHSDIRRWLNKDFLEYAFSAEQIERIVTSKVDNSDEGNRFACENTNDKIFLLSKNEAETLFPNGASRVRKPTDYAKCQGAFSGSERLEAIAKRGTWWLRTPDRFASNFSDTVSLYGGCTLSTQFCCYTETGVVPAMIIKL